MASNALIVGTSGGGKSTLATGFVERLRAQGYSFCIIDPEGDYDSFEAAVVLGGAEHPPEDRGVHAVLVQARSERRRSTCSA